MSYTLPHSGNSRTNAMGTQSATYTDEREETVAEVIGNRDFGRKLLMFHGIILRSQLIELLKHKVFFNETDGVRI